MRFLKIFFSVLGLLTLTTITVVWFLIQGQVYLAGLELEKDLEKVVLLASSPRKEDLKSCMMGLPYPVESYQLRFTSTQNYVIEAICAEKTIAPIEIEQGQLADKVTKAGGSGLKAPVVLNDYASAKAKLNGWVVLANRFSKVKVGYFEGKMEMKKPDEEADLNYGISSPKTSCEGWGYRCCSAITEVGEGDLETQTSDCMGACFPVCGQRPVLTFFNTDPLVDQETRVLELFGKEVEVSFGFEVSDADNRIKKVRVVFGDGQVYESAEPGGLANHKYRCLEDVCQYRAFIEAEDEVGYKLAETRYREVMIVQYP